MVRGPGRKRKEHMIKDSDSDWMKNALCIGVDPEEFFPNYIEDKRRPLKVNSFIESMCGRCPVTKECLTYAITYEQIGIWGGTTDYTREQLKKKTIKRRCPGCGGTSLFTDFNNEVICNSCGLSWTSF